MRVLVDTHVFFWWVTDDPKLSPRIRQTLADGDNETLVSAIIAWEMATKVRIGKWPEAAEIVASVEIILEANAFQSLPVTLAHARAAGLLPGRHRDPFDRLLAAQAQVENIPLVSADPVFRSLGVQVLW